MDQNLSQIVGRALEVLEAVVAAPGPVTLTAVIEQTGLDKSTASRALAFLAEKGWLTRDAATRRYSTGPRSFALAAAVGARSDIRLIAGPHLERLREQTGESASLHLLVGARRVCVDGRESTKPVRRVVTLGESLAIYQGPSGKVILAYLSDSERDELLVSLPADQRVRVLADLESARSQGYLHTDGDRTAGIRAVSAPIFDARGVTGSLSVAGPSWRWTAEAGEAAAELTVSAAAAMSSSLGALR